MRERYISPSVVRRLPKYHRCLTELENMGEDRVSSSGIAKLLGFTASQVRQDFSCFGGFGQQGYGYNVKTLRAEIGAIIGINKNHSAVIIGVGNLGHAIVNNFGFSDCGVKLCAAFDTNPDLVGTKMGGVEVKDASEIESFYKENPFDIAILTVPKQHTHRVAALLEKLGVRGIWNFTNTDLKFENQNICVENVHFSDSLMILNYGISEKE